MVLAQKVLASGVTWLDKLASFVCFIFFCFLYVSMWIVSVAKSSSSLVFLAHATLQWPHLAARGARKHGLFVFCLDVHVLRKK